jgi:phosphohistidine phosphatase
MRRLWLLRHAKSSWDDPSLPDEERPLAVRGHRAVAAVAEHLTMDPIGPTLVLCSSSLRTRQTLAGILPALGRSLEVRIEPLLYTFDEGVLLRRLASLPPDADPVLLVGHNPAMQELALHLAATGTRLKDLATKFPTGALACLELDVAAWTDVRRGCAALTSFVTPRELAHHT